MVDKCPHDTKVTLYYDKHASKDFCLLKLQTNCPNFPGGGATQIISSHGFDQLAANIFRIHFVEKDARMYFDEFNDVLIRDNWQLIYEGGVLEG